MLTGAASGCSHKVIVATIVTHLESWKTGCAATNSALPEKLANPAAEDYRALFRRGGTWPVDFAALGWEQAELTAIN